MCTFENKSEWVPTIVVLSPFRHEARYDEAKHQLRQPSQAERIFDYRLGPAKTLEITVDNDG